MTAMDYASAGVDISKEEEAVASIGDYVKKTLSFREGKVGAPLVGLGHFSGLVDLGDRALAISTDGVGTKVLVAKELGTYDTLGIDLMAMNVNDIICIGATPIAFVDTISIQRPDPAFMAEIGKGLLEGARQAEVSIIGGETATVPDLLTGDGDGFDLMGTAVGIVDKDRIITGDAIKPGDVVLGLESSGIHSNGLTLARKAVPKEEYFLLIEPTRIYVKAVLDLLEKVRPSGLAHITGSGLCNLKRLKEGIGFDLSMPPPLPVFQVIQHYAGADNTEMYRTFNMGVGFVVIVDPADAPTARAILSRHHVTYDLGTVTSDGTVTAHLSDGSTIHF